MLHTYCNFKYEKYDIFYEIKVLIYIYEGLGTAGKVVSTLLYFTNIVHIFFK